MPSSSSIQWRKLETGRRPQCRWNTSRLEYTLRRIHKRKISWPIEDSMYSNGLTHDEYLLMLLRPIASVCNQLHDPSILKTPMECVNIDLGHSVWAATFAAEHFKRWAKRCPIIVCIPSNSLFQPNGEVSPSVESALSVALEHTPTATIIATNFKEIAVFCPPEFSAREHTFEQISTAHPILALRVLSLAYLLQSDCGSLLIAAPDPDIEIPRNVVLPQGPTQDPHQPLLADEKVFATHQRNSDFDRATLVRDRARALQFFRWHRHVRSSFSKLVANPDDVLTAKTHETGQIRLDFRPIYPFEASEVPSETKAHLQETRRESPLVTAGVAKFISSTPVPQIIRRSISATGGPDEDDALVGGDLPRWFDEVVCAEKEALNEAFAYDKLLPMRGSVVPWFYGIHQFTLPDGTVLYGLLMEYIEGWRLDSEYVRDLPPARQAQMVRSLELALAARAHNHGSLSFRFKAVVTEHAFSIVADVSQRDWHSKQVILTTNPMTKVDHAVLVDFANTTQTWEPHEPNFIDNYWGMFQVLLGKDGDVALDSKLVLEHYGEPDDWDPVHHFIPTIDSEGNRKSRTVKGKDMFPYISSI
ncbi:hypothetical protein BKA70DRAFT_1472060 [Coprinopsis sp. MPI-PUGE-AT-0042]|nr:hypothetical protein BKA70DRAFT_1472060 [Coprinopsis sp. MPI-PUGE-AT-0042]